MEVSVVVLHGGGGSGGGRGTLEGVRARPWRCGGGFGGSRSSPPFHTQLARMGSREDNFSLFYSYSLSLWLSLGCGLHWWLLEVVRECWSVGEGLMECGEEEF